MASLYQFESCKRVNAMRMLLFVLFASILVAMLGVTTYASLDCSILNVSSDLTSDPWFHATLADAYFGFLTFYVWVFYKERTALRRFVWFLLIMLLGNIAMACYVLWQLSRWRTGVKLDSILLRAYPYRQRFMLST